MALRDGHTGKALAMAELTIDDLREPGLYESLYRQAEGWTLYHTPEWLRFLDATVPGERLDLGLYRADRLVGLMPARRRRVGPFRLFASPMAGWCTPYLGPIWLEPLEVEAFMAALQGFLKRRGFHHAEMCSLDPRLTQWPGWHRETTYTYVAPLDPDPDRLLAGFGKSCRKSVRRAEREGVRVEFAEDERFIDIYYGQLQEVFAKRNLRPTYAIDRVRTLWRCLRPAGRLLTSWAVWKGDVIATRVDMLGNKVLHSFGSASYQATLKLHPNELLRFFAMSWAGRNGFTHIDMSGGGAYKEKFNAELQEEPHLLLSSPLLRWARHLARKAFYLMKRGAARGSPPAEAAPPAADAPASGPGET
ncbi:MAG: GNAT family N-acetyltransferase [Planctomycetota bacterium]|nr:GNAT family N-acetyltransferase [Planctomycetota bacterium]